MNDIIFDATFFFQEMPINSTWNTITLEPVSNYYIIRLALPERISIS